MTARDLHTLLSHAAGADARSDAELLADAANPAALTALVRRHGPLVWGTARRMLPDPADAADAFQAVFLALTKSYRRIRTPAAVGGWLHAATVRVCLKQRRQLARRRLREMRIVRPEAVVPVADTAWDAILAAVHEEIHRLPDGERTAFVVCELQGVPQPEAAKRLGWKPGTLTGRLSKARAKLLTALSARGFAPAAGLAGVGALAVPAEVLALAEPAATVSPAVAALSTEVTAMVTTKHLAAAVVLTAGLLAGVGGGLVAQDRGGAPPPADPSLPVIRDGGVRLPKPDAPPAGGSFPGMPPAGVIPAGGPAAPVRWEYDYQVQPPLKDDFVSLVNNRGQAGWELAAVVQVSAGQTMRGRGGMAPGMAGEGGGMGPAGGGMPGAPGGGSDVGGGMPGMMGGGAGAGGMMGGRAGGGVQVVNLLVFKRPAGGASAGDRPALPPDAMNSPVGAPRGMASPGGGWSKPTTQPKPAESGHMFSLQLRHAKAGEVAKLVEKLLAPSDGEQNLTGVPSRFVAAPDDRRNVILVRLDGTGRPTEQQVRDLVKELDVPTATNQSK